MLLLWLYCDLSGIHGGRPCLDKCDDVYEQSGIAISLVEPDVVLFVDQVSMLTSSAQPPSELRVSPHVPRRLLFLKLGTGFENCDMDGKCALDRRFGKMLGGLSTLYIERCDIGDCICISPMKGRTLGAQDSVGDVCDRYVARSRPLGRYRGFRIGHEIPVCSKMSVIHQYMDMNGMCLIVVPFGACWNEKQTISLVAPTSASPGLVDLVISCSDSVILIRPFGSRASHELCMRVRW